MQNYSVVSSLVERFESIFDLLNGQIEDEREIISTDVAEEKQVAEKNSLSNSRRDFEDILKHTPYSITVKLGRWILRALKPFRCLLGVEAR